VAQAHELSLMRVLWLSTRVPAGQGKREEAMAGLEQVGRYFTERQLPYDAARAALELAALWLEVGRTAEVRELAVGLGWIFKAKKIHREALAGPDPLLRGRQAGDCHGSPDPANDRRDRKGQAFGPSPRRGKAGNEPDHE
jgi:hypothetical protein